MICMDTYQQICDSHLALATRLVDDLELGANLGARSNSGPGLADGSVKVLQQHVLASSRLATPGEVKAWVGSTRRPVRFATADIIFPPIHGTAAIDLIVPQGIGFALADPFGGKTGASFVRLADERAMNLLAFIHHRLAVADGRYRNYG